MSAGGYVSRSRKPSSSRVMMEEFTSGAGHQGKLYPLTVCNSTRGGGNNLPVSLAGLLDSSYRSISGESTLDGGRPNSRLDWSRDSERANVALTPKTTIMMNERANIMLSFLIGRVQFEQYPLAGLVHVKVVFT